MKLMINMIKKAKSLKFIPNFLLTDVIKENGNFKTKNGILIMQSTFLDCEFKKSRFAKEQEAKGLLSDYSIVKYFVLNAFPLTV